MASVPVRVADRLVAGIKKFQPILNDAKARGDGEADTVKIITEMLSDVFGYDKFSEITAEIPVKGSRCDLATKVDGKVRTLYEGKAIGLELKDQHVMQAVDYAAKQPCDWVVLTNGALWRVYRVTFTKPIDSELVVEIDFLALAPKNQQDLETLFLLCREGCIKSVLSEYHTQKQALGRYLLGAMILADPVLNVIRRELRRVSPDVKIDTEQIKAVLVTEVIKQEVMEGEKADEARRKIAKAASKSLKSKSSKSDEGVGDSDCNGATNDASSTTALSPQTGTT